MFASTMYLQILYFIQKTLFIDNNKVRIWDVKIPTIVTQLFHFINMHQCFHTNFTFYFFTLRLLLTWSFLRMFSIRSWWVCLGRALPTIHSRLLNLFDNLHSSIPSTDSNHHHKKHKCENRVFLLSITKYFSKYILLCYVSFKHSLGRGEISKTEK